MLRAGSVEPTYGRMHRKIPSSILIGLAVAGCNAPPVELVDPAFLGQAEWQLVDREYPYTGENGEMVCGEWQRPSPETDEIIELDREIYHPEVMNRQLYGEPLPGEEIDPEIIEAIRAAGTVSVETCEDARGFLEIKQDVIESYLLAQPRLARRAGLSVVGLRP